MISFLRATGTKTKDGGSPQGYARARGGGRSGGQAAPAGRARGAEAQDDVVAAQVRSPTQVRASEAAVRRTNRRASASVASTIASFSTCAAAELSVRCGHLPSLSALITSAALTTHTSTLTLSICEHWQLREEDRLRQERSRGGDRGRERDLDRALRRAQEAQERERERERGVGGGSGAKEKYHDDGGRERGVARARGGGRGVPLSKGSLREGSRAPGDGGVGGLESYEDDDHLAAVRASDDTRVCVCVRARASLPLSLSLTLTHSLTLSLSLSHTHTHTLSLSASLPPTLCVCTRVRERSRSAVCAWACVGALRVRVRVHTL